MALSGNRNFVPLLIAQTCAAVLVFLLVMLWPGEWNAERWVGAIIAIPSMILLLTARFQLGRSFSVSPQARTLVTHGLYSKIRNPMYVFSALLVLGFLLTLQKPFLFVILAVLVPTQVIRAHQEGKVLQAKFGDEYREYRKRTWF
ncbi:MAG: Isoprenylcysteine carboxyl methyltransferase [Acidobacteriaceae bacterium]|nr:Isoprenylcysteine carboxyl methyltransferase [Acidobacteriaceae bacterium]